MTKLTTLYADYGQSPWIDNLRRDWLEDGHCRPTSTTVYAD